MAIDDWSGFEDEGSSAGGAFSAEDFDEAFAALDEAIDIEAELAEIDYQIALDEAFAELESEIDLDLGVDPFADDVEDYGTMDWREMVSEDFNENLRGPFPDYQDALEYIDNLAFASWDIIYDDIDEVWYAQIGISG